METILKKVPKDLVEENPHKFTKWFTETIKSNFSNEIDLFLEIRKKEHHKKSLERLITKKPLINANKIHEYFNPQNLNTMKNLILIIALAFSFTLTAQFDATKGKKTEKQITIEGKSFNIMETAKGSEYILCTSPTSRNSYAVWVGTATEKTQEGKPVRVSKTGKEFVILISERTKNPYCKYLKKEENNNNSKS